MYLLWFFLLLERVWMLQSTVRWFLVFAEFTFSDQHFLFGVLFHYRTYELKDCFPHHIVIQELPESCPTNPHRTPVLCSQAMPNVS